MTKRHIQRQLGHLKARCGLDLRYAAGNWLDADQARNVHTSYVGFGDETCQRCKLSFESDALKETALDEVYLTRWDCRTGRLEAA